MLRNKRGISLTTMVVTVLIMLLIMGTLVYSAVDSVKIRKLNKLYNDLRQLDDAVGIYYLKNGSLPVYPEAEDEDNVMVVNKDDTRENLKLKSWDFVLASKVDTVSNQNSFFNPNDYIVDGEGAQSAIYRKINLELLDNISLNYPTNEYFVNTQSLTVYNFTGVTINNVTYHALPLTYKDTKYKENNAVTAIRLKTATGITSGSTFYLSYDTESINLKDYIVFDSTNGRELGEPKEVGFNYVNEPIVKYFDLNGATGVLTRINQGENIDGANSTTPFQVSVLNYNGTTKTATFTIQLTSINVYTNEAQESARELVDTVNLAVNKNKQTYNIAPKITSGDDAYIIRRDGGAIFSLTNPNLNPNIKTMSENSEIATATYTKPETGMGNTFGTVKFDSGTKAGSTEITFEVENLGFARDTVTVNVYDFKVYEGSAGSNTDIDKVEFKSVNLQKTDLYLNVEGPGFNETDENKITFDGIDNDIVWSEVKEVVSGETKTYEPNTTGCIRIDAYRTGENVNFKKATITPLEPGKTFIKCEYKVKGEVLGYNIIPVMVYGGITTNLTGTDKTNYEETDTIALKGENKTVELTYELYEDFIPEGATVSYSFESSNTDFAVTEETTNPNTTGIFTVEYKGTSSEATAETVTITATVKKGSTETKYEDTVKITYASNT